MVTFISSTESMATPAIPTSPNTRGLSESYLVQSKSLMTIHDYSLDTQLLQYYCQNVTQQFAETYDLITFEDFLIILPQWKCYGKIAVTSFACRI